MRFNKRENCIETKTHWKSQHGNSNVEIKSVFFFPNLSIYHDVLFPVLAVWLAVNVFMPKSTFFSPPPYCQHVTSGEADQILPLGLNPAPSGKQDTICCHWAGRRSVRRRCQGRPLPPPPLPPPPSSANGQQSRSKVTGPRVTCEVPALEVTGAVFEKKK